MSNLQIFQLFGIAFLVVGIGMLKNPEIIKKLLDELEQSTTVVYLSGLVSLVIGFLLITFHNDWDMNQSLIITLIGWSAMIKGVSILLWPNFSLRISEKIVKENNRLNYFAWFGIVLGLVCLLFGYSFFE